ncbi:MAG: glycosyltransferase family 9 protein [Alphaproteobacteria bacterium]|nr:glycosyltransferase family 9 protein [Alphaproteobacteria bacterium]
MIATPAQILFIAPTRIGDAVLATSLLEHIRTTNPNAQVTIIASPFSAPLFSGYPNLEALHIIDKQSFSRHWLRIWKIAITKQWAEVWDMRGSTLAYLCAARKRHIFKSSPQPMPKHEQYRVQLGLSSLAYPTLWPQAADNSKAEQLIGSHDKIIALAPCANWIPKEWPIAHFIELSRRLFSELFKGYRPLIVCAAHERERALPLLNALKDFHPIDATTGDLPLLAVYAAFCKAHGFIGNDSGLMHMAAAASIPTLGLFGPTDDVTYQPCGSKVAYVVAPERDLKKLQPKIALEKFVTLVSREESH